MIFAYSRCGVERQGIGGFAAMPVWRSGSTLRHSSRHQYLRRWKISEKEISPSNSALMTRVVLLRTP